MSLWTGCYWLFALQDRPRYGRKMQARGKACWGKKNPQALHLSRAHGWELASEPRTSSVIRASCQRDGHTAASVAASAKDGQRPSEGRKGARPQPDAAVFIVALHLPISFREVIPRSEEHTSELQS